MPPFTRSPVFHRGSSSIPASYWKGSRTPGAVPLTAILTEDGDPILTEAGDFLLTES